MSLFHLQAHFWQLDAQQRFSAPETRLYFYWLNRFNAEFWPEQLARTCRQVEADLSLTDKPHAAAREALIVRGLLHYQEGSKSRAAVWSLVGVTPTNTPIPRSNSEESTSIAPNIGRSNSDESGPITPNIPRSNSDPFIDKTKTKEEREEESNAANAATPPVSFSIEGSKKSKSTRSPKKPAAQADEVAALALPFKGELFAQRWATFRAGPKQARKPLSAFELMLSKLGKYPEAFAVEMLEAAIQGDWSGVENDGTARKYAEWKTHHPPAASTPATSYNVAGLFGQKKTMGPDFDPSALFRPASPSPEPNPEFVAEQQAKEAAAQAAHFARYSTPPDPEP